LNNNNSFALVPAQPTVATLLPQQKADTLLLLGTHPNMLNPNPPTSPVIQIALKNNIDVFYFQMNIPLHVLLGENGQLGKEEYLALWKGINEEHFKDIPASSTNPDVVQKKMQSNNYFYIARHKSASEVQQTLLCPIFFLLRYLFFFFFFSF
jgi:AP-1 complex subunit beta-1